MATFTVAASADDTNSGSNSAAGSGTGNVISTDLTSTLLSPGSHGASNYWYSGCRFLAVAVAQGATISAATFSMKAQASYSSPGTVKYIVKGQASDNPVTFGTNSGTNSLSTTARPRTTAASASWDQKTVVGGTRYSIDVTSVVQEIVNRAGWASGNALVILVEVDATTTIGEWQDYYAWDDATDRTNNPPQLAITTGGAAATSLPLRPQGRWQQHTIIR